jgi:hypothetical protein
MLPEVTGMSKKEHVGLSGIQKTALIALCLLTTWQLLQNDKITNSLAALLFGGVIPGTDKVLPPEIMMYIAGGVALMVALLVTIHFMRRSKRLHPKPLQYEIAQAEQAKSLVASEAASVEIAPIGIVVEQFIETPTQPEIVAPEAAVIETKVRHPVTVAPFFASVHKATRILLAFMVLHSGKLGVVLQKAAKQTAHIVRLLAVQTLRISKIGTRYLFKASIIAHKNIIIGSIAAWRWTEPHLREFDKWLELRFRDIQKWGRKKAHQHEDAQLFFDISRKSVKILNQFATKSIQKMSIVQKPRDEDFTED